MFDIGFWELCLVAVIALIVLGPERLPHAARTAGLWVRRARRMVSELRADIESEFEIEELNRMSAGYRRAKDRKAAGKASPDPLARSAAAGDGSDTGSGDLSGTQAEVDRGTDGATKADLR